MLWHPDCVTKRFIARAEIYVMSTNYEQNVSTHKLIPFSIKAFIQYSAKINYKKQVFSRLYCLFFVLFIANRANDAITMAVQW